MKIILLLALGSLSNLAAATPLLSPELTQFAVYSAHDLSYACTDIEGPTGAAGSATLTRILVNGDLSAGGDVTFADGQVHGNVEAGGNLFLRNYQVDAASAGGEATCFQGTSFSCASGIAVATQHAAVVQAMADGAATIASLAPTASGHGDGTGNLTLQAPAGLAVIDLDTTTLAASKQITIAGPATAAAIVRISGDVIDLGSVPYTVTLTGGLVPGSVLFAFLDAKSVSLANVTMPGTVFAPNATLSFYSGAITGGLYANAIDSFAFPGVDLQTTSVTCQGGLSAAQVTFAPFSY